MAYRRGRTARGPFDHAVAFRRPFPYDADRECAVHAANGSGARGPEVPQGYDTLRANREPLVRLARCRNNVVIGRASCRERVCSVRVGMGGSRYIKKKNILRNEKSTIVDT